MDLVFIFDRYVRFSTDINKIETARYRICQCAVNSSNSFQRDQSDTKYALEQLQMFIEDFPESKYIKEAENDISLLRNKLAQKDYEVGRMYVKLEEYEAAIIYFQSVLNSYYDTKFSDEARIGIIFTHILNGNRQGSENYLESQKGKFISENKYNEAQMLIKDTEDGLKLTHYYQLYK